MTSTYTVPDNPAAMTTSSSKVIDLAARREHKVTIEFHAVISSWDEAVRCEITTNKGTRCSRPARLRVNFHGCAITLECQQHFDSWRRSALAQEAAGLKPKCDECGRAFGTVDDTYTVVAL